MFGVLKIPKSPQPRRRPYLWRRKNKSGKPYQPRGPRLPPEQKKAYYLKRQMQEAQRQKILLEIQQEDRMHPAPSLFEAPPVPDEQTESAPLPPSPMRPQPSPQLADSAVAPPASSPVRKDTNSSVVTTATTATTTTASDATAASTVASVASSEATTTAGKGVGMESVPLEAVGSPHSGSSMAAINNGNNGHQHVTTPDGSMVHPDGDITMTNGDPNGSFSDGGSPSLSIFSVRNGEDLSNNRRATRRRTGPLSAQQREKAALIRKLGACGDCRRRRVACHPNHHNMTWEDAITKFASHPPDLTAMGVRPLSHSPTQDAHMFAQEPQEMDVDPVGSHQQAPAPGAAPRPAPPPIALAAAPPPPGRPLLSSDARIRTPLPSGPGSRHQHDKPLAMMSSGATLNNGGANHVQPNPNHAGGSHPGHPGGPPPIAPLVTGRGGNLQAAANRIFSNPYRSRYSAVQVLILYWQDEDDRDVTAAINDLAETFDKMYRYTFELSPIPTSAENCKSPWRWLSRKINDFVEHRDQRDVLKIVYYNGHSFLDANREMVLASPKDRDQTSTIRWSGIQQILEEAIADTLIIMDAAYFPSSKMVRAHGVLELVAASASDHHMRMLGRATFTRALSEQLRARTTQQRFLDPFTASELHSRLLSAYPKITRDREPERDRVHSVPSPLHLRIAASSRLLPIVLVPMELEGAGRLMRPLPFKEARINLAINLTDVEALSEDAWIEWLRMMPDGVRDVKLEGPYSAFRS